MEARRAAIFIFLLNNIAFVATHCTFHDYSMGTNHLDCSRKELVNIYGINVYDLLLSLDLSHNEFVKITDNMFQGTQFAALETLNFRFNKIWQIGSYAFNGLNALKGLDLSHNQILTLDWNAWPALVMLNVSFNYLEDASRVQCSTLEILDISNNNVGNLILANDLINLKHLNISANKIPTLPSEQFLKLSLFSLQIAGNSKIRCDTATTNLLQYLTNRGVDVKPTCPFASIMSDVPSIVPHNSQPENPILTPNNAILVPNYKDNHNLNALEQNQAELLQFTTIIFFTQIAVIALLIFLTILLITFRLRDASKKKSRRRELFPLEETDDDVPPPPYRNHTSGFVI